MGIRQLNNFIILRLNKKIKRENGRVQNLRQGRRIQQEPKRKGIQHEAMAHVQIASLLIKYLLEARKLQLHVKLAVCLLARFPFHHF